MTIETQVKSILAATTAIVESVNSQAQTLTTLVTAVANIPASTGTAPDLTQINNSLSALNDGQTKLLAATKDIQAQLEDAPDAPAPSPAPAADTPAVESTDTDTQTPS